MFQLFFLFSHFEELKSTFSHRSISPTRYVLKSFSYLEVSNRVRNWNKVKKRHFRGVESSIMPIGNTNIHIKINVSVFIEELKSTFFSLTCYVLKRFVCLGVSNRVSNWNKGRKIIFVCSILQICKFEIPVFIYIFISKVCTFWLFLLIFR